MEMSPGIRAGRPRACVRNKEETGLAGTGEHAKEKQVRQTGGW